MSPNFEKAILKMMEVGFVDSAPYSQLDHVHCWNQGKSPACGQKLEWHEVCCLCAIPYGDS